MKTLVYLVLDVPRSHPRLGGEILQLNSLLFCRWQNASWEQLSVQFEVTPPHQLGQEPGFLTSRPLLFHYREQLPVTLPVFLDFPFVMLTVLLMNLFLQSLSWLPGAAVTKRHELGCLSTTEIYSLTVLGTKTLKSRCWQGRALSEVSRRICSTPFPWLLGSLVALDGP